MSQAEFSRRLSERGVLITGASSGIGAAVAAECARRGARTLFLAGRSRERLERTAAACRAAGALRVDVRALDVTDAAAMEGWLAECDGVCPLGLVFANAGQGTGRETGANVRRTFAVNVGGVLNTVLPAIDLMRAHSAGGVRGQIVITASIAGYAPLSGCPAYAATKAGMKSWGLSLRGLLRREGIRVNAVCPGFVRSGITDRNTCPMPFFLEAPVAARKILDGVARNEGLIAFPAPMRLAVWLLSILPWRLAEWVARLLPAKNDEAGSF